MGSGTSSTKNASCGEAQTREAEVDSDRLANMRTNISEASAPVDSVTLNESLKRGVPVKELRRFARRHRGLNMHQIAKQTIIPHAVKTGQRYHEVLAPGLHERATTFLSYQWNDTFHEVASAVCTVLPDDSLVWVDVFAVQQYLRDSEVPAETCKNEELRKIWHDDVKCIKHVMRNVDNMVNVVVAHEGSPVHSPGWTRAWIVLDFAGAMDAGINLALLVGHDADATGDFTPDYELARRLVGSVQLTDANMQCSYAEDRIAITEHLHKKYGSLEDVVDYIEAALRRAASDMLIQLNDIFLWLTQLERELKHPGRYARYAPAFVENFATIRDVSELRGEEVPRALDACGVKAYGDLKHLATSIADLASNPLFAALPSFRDKMVDDMVEAGCDGSVAKQQPINKPGYWDFFISYTQHCRTAELVAQTLYQKLKWEAGYTCWRDKDMDDKSEAAMKEGVLGANFFIAVVSDHYLQRPFCLKELAWAKRSGKIIQPVVSHDDKGRIGVLVNSGPPEVQFLTSIDFVDLIMTDKEYTEVGVQKIIKNVAKTYSESNQLSGRQRELAGTAQS